MAYKKNDTIKKLDSFAQLLYGARFIRFLFFFYGFISLVFWFLNCFEVDWLHYFNFLFVIPYSIVSNFYTPEGLVVDLTLAIIGIISILIGVAVDHIVDNIYQRVLDLREDEERKVKKQRERERNTMKKRAIVQQPELETTISTENTKLVFLILPHVNKIRKKQSDLELTFQEVEIWKQKVIKKILEHLNYSKPQQKGYYRKNLFLIYKDFNYVDDFMYYTKPTLDSITLEFRKLGIAVSYSYVLSSIINSDALEKELDCMDTILSLYFVNEPIVTNRFKLTYDNKPNHQYSVKYKGEYNLSKNLSISNQQPLYSLLEKEKKEGNKHRWKWKWKL